MVFDKDLAPIGVGTAIMQRIATRYKFGVKRVRVLNELIRDFILILKLELVSITLKRSKGPREER